MTAEGSTERQHLQPEPLLDRNGRAPGRSTFTTSQHLSAEQPSRSRQAAPGPLFYMSPQCLSQTPDTGRTEAPLGSLLAGGQPHPRLLCQPLLTAWNSASYTATASPLEGPAGAQTWAW